MATYSNLFIDQGSDFSSTTTLTQASLTGYSARGQIRKTYASSTVTATFVASLDTSTKIITFSLPAATTATLSSGRYVYDIEIFNTDSPEKVTRVLEGQVEVTPGVTRT